MAIGATFVFAFLLINLPEDLLKNENTAYYFTNRGYYQEYGEQYEKDNNIKKTEDYIATNGYYYDKEAILTGTKGNNILIYGGGFFTFVSFTFILIALSILGYFDKFKIDIIRTYIGLLFIIIGIGMVLVKNGETASLTETIKAFKLWILIPIMFIVVGVHQFILALLNKNKGGTI